MRICPKCGFKIENDEAKFCKKCGSRLHEIEKIAEEAYVIGMMKGIIKSCKSLNASREYALSQPLSG